MKRSVKLLTALCLTMALLTACGSNTTTETSGDTGSNTDGAAGTEAFAPSNPITYNVSSKAGGNSDLITRTVTDIATKMDLVNGQSFVVVNNTDGSGNIIRITTSETDDPDHTLLCMSSGDMQSMLTSDVGLTLDNFAPIATLAADKQLIFGLAGSDMTTFEDVMAAIEAGEKINVGGTKSNEMTVFEMFVEEIGASDSFNYMMYDSSAESITALMGGHIDMCMGSPAAAVAYVKSGDIVPVVAFSDTRFEAPLDQAPTMEELGYDVVQSPMWRGVVAPASMSQEAQEYWNDVFRQVTESEEWQEYLSSYLLSPYFNDLETTRTIMNDTQTELLAEMGG